MTRTHPPSRRRFGDGLAPVLGLAALGARRGPGRQRCPSRPSPRRPRRWSSCTRRRPSTPRSSWRRTRATSTTTASTSRSRTSRAPAETTQLLATDQSQSGGSTWGAGFFNSIAQNASDLGRVAAREGARRHRRRSRSRRSSCRRTGTTAASSTTVAELAGKNVGIPCPGAFGEYSVYLALQSGGLTLDDVEVGVVGPPDAAAALDNGQVDASFTHRAARVAVRGAGPHDVDLRRPRRRRRAGVHRLQRRTGCRTTRTPPSASPRPT